MLSVTWSVRQHRPMVSPHLSRSMAEGFGDDAALYDRARPGYPPDLAEAIVSMIPGRRVLDVGIGTGLSALPFREAGCTVAGVEPDPRMAALARGRGFEVDVARFEEWDPAGREFDAVISGQSWHWVEPVTGAAKAAAALPPSGVLALFWNAGDPPPALASAFGEIYRMVETGLPFTPWADGQSAVSGYTGFLDVARDGMKVSGRFGEPESLNFPWQATITRDAWLEMVPTSGGHNRIPAPALEELLDRLGEAINRHGGTFVMSYTTVGLAARTTGT